MNSESVQANRYIERNALGAAGKNGMMGFRLCRTVLPIQQLADLMLNAGACDEQR
jgi:hypothetical protein